MWFGIMKFTMKFLTQIYFLLFSINALFAQKIEDIDWNFVECCSEDRHKVCNSWASFGVCTLGSGAGNSLCNMTLYKKPHNGPCAFKDHQKGDPPYFFVIDMQQYSSPWERVSPYAYCGEQHCDRALSFTESRKVTETSGNGTQTTNSESLTDTNSESLTHSIAVGLKLQVPYIEFGPDYSFTQTYNKSSSNTRMRSEASSKTYSYAIGKSFTRTDTITCKGNPHQRMYTGLQTHFTVIKGNRCTQSRNLRWLMNCKYVEIQTYAMLRGGILDADLRCFSETNPDYK